MGGFLRPHFLSTRAFYPTNGHMKACPYIPLYLRESFEVGCLRPAFNEASRHYNLMASLNQLHGKG